jgi:hypothetical protein
MDKPMLVLNIAVCLQKIHRTIHLMTYRKKEGNIRKFSYSVLDSTFNLNIAPEKGGNSVVTTGSINGVQQGSS